MTFDRSADGGLTELTQHNVDTGMGLERIALFLNGHNSVWQLDEMVRLHEAVADPLGTSPDRLDEGAMRSLRIVTDHLRAGLAIAAAGIFPSATRQGYVLRKLIRRAVRHAELLTGTDQGLAAALATSTANASEIIGRALARRRRRRDRRPGARDHRQGDREVLQDGPSTAVENLHEVADETGVFDGDLAFRLADERGFPAELSLEEAQRMGLTVDPDWNVRYEELRELQRARSRRVSAGGLVDSTAASPALGLTAAEVAERVADGQVNTFAASAGRSTSADRARQRLHVLQPDRRHAVRRHAGRRSDPGRPVRPRRHRQHADRHRAGGAGQAVARTPGADRATQDRRSSATAR